MYIVKEKYEQNVHAGHMSEADFWRTFFQSHYFTMDRMQPSHSRDLFADCVKRDDEKMLDEAERASRKAMSVIAPETNETSEVRHSFVFSRHFFFLLKYFDIDWLWC